MCLHKMNNKENQIYVIVEQLLCGTAEDDVMVGYCDTRREAVDITREMEKRDSNVHYAIREVSKLW